MATISDERLRGMIYAFSLTPHEAELHSALLELQSLRSQAGVSEAVAWEFDRYVNGVLMAEGVSIKQATTKEQAMCKAAAIASRGHNGKAPVLVLVARPAPIEITKEQELTQNMARALPGGQMDDSSYSAIEDALDAIQAPMCDSGGRFLTLVQRIAALQGETK